MNSTSNKTSSRRKEKRRELRRPVRRPAGGVHALAELEALFSPALKPWAGGRRE